MSYQDKSIQCSDCAVTFTFSADEQEQFASRGYTNAPKRCPACRQARKAQQFGSNGSNYGTRSYGDRPSPRMFPVKCSDCGKDTEVPFEPTNGRPVYCRECYSKVRISR